MDDASELMFPSTYLPAVRDTPPPPLISSRSVSLCLPLSLPLFFALSFLTPPTQPPHPLSLLRLPTVPLSGSLLSLCLWVPEVETSVGEPLIMVPLTAIEGDVWRDETRVPENLGWPAYVPLTSLCVCVCGHCNG